MTGKTGMTDAVVKCRWLLAMSIDSAYNRIGLPHRIPQPRRHSGYLQIGWKSPQKQWPVAAKRHTFDADSGKRLKFRKLANDANGRIGTTRVSSSDMQDGASIALRAAPI